MRLPRFLVLSRLLPAVALLAACGSELPGPSAGGTPATTPPGGAGEPPATGKTDPAAPAIASSLRFSQAVSGAFFVNPKVYPSVPLRLRADGLVSSVRVSVGDTSVEATVDGAGPSAEWVAMLDTSKLEFGSTRLQASAVVLGGEPIRAEAELLVGDTGQKLTDWVEVGSANSPRIHRFGDETFLTWIDHGADDQARAWMRAIDGAGRWRGEPVQLLADAAGLFSMEVVPGKDVLGVLYQTSGQDPFATRFRLLGADGSPRTDPVVLDTDGLSSTSGMALQFDGEGFVMVWKAVSSDVKNRIRWARVGLDGTTTGPIEIWGPTGSNDEGGNSVSAGVSLAVRGEISVVTLPRQRLNQYLGDIRLPKCTYAVLDRTGDVLARDFCADDQALSFHDQARVFPFGEGFLTLWGEEDVSGKVDNAPTVFMAAPSDAFGKIDSNMARLVVTAANHRNDPVLEPHPSGSSVMVWEDQRREKVRSTTLYAAMLGAEGAATDERLFPHAILYSAQSDVDLTLAGSNVEIVWVDDRLSSVERHPQLYFETLWY